MRFCLLFIAAIAADAADDPYAAAKSKEVEKATSATIHFNEYGRLLVCRLGKQHSLR